jgi:single-strand DNA-binding protein
MARSKSTTTAAEGKKAEAQAQQEPVTIIGRLCADPVLRHTKSGKPVTTIRVAVNTPDSEPTFHSVVVWNRSAEVVCEYLRKGRRVEVVGRTQQRSYTAADGTDREVTEVVAFRVNFLSGQGSDPAPEEEPS